jgi:hypothetical protein
MGVSLPKVGVDVLDGCWLHGAAIVGVPRTVESDTVGEDMHTTAVAMVMGEEELGVGGLISPYEEVWEHGVAA